MSLDWETRALGDVTEVIAGQSPEGSFYNSAGDGMPFYQGKKEFGIRSIGAPTMWTTKVTKVALEGDVLMSVRAPVGPVNFATQKSCIGRGLAAIRNGKQLNKDFLFYFLLSKEDEISGTEGAVFASINKNDIERIEILVPPLPEQQRIVAILDEAFDGIAAAKANAEKNLQNARAIFESHLQAVFTEKAKQWPDLSLGDVFDIGSSKRIYETDWTSQGVPFFGGREIVKLAKYGSVESASFISEEKYQEYASKYEMPQAGDILMTARGTIGVGYIVKPGDKFYYKDGNVISLRAKNPSNPQFLLYAFRSNAILDQLTVLVGTTVSHLPIEKAKVLKICIPTFEVQNFIVEHLEMMEAHSKKLESIYQKKLAALDELKKSLLHQAFSGAL